MKNQEFIIIITTTNTFSYVFCFFLTGGKVSGYNIDPNQIQNAKDYAVETNFQDRLDFKVGNHHDPLDYADASFDGCYSFQAIWPFFKPNELLAYTKEMYRVLKPGNLFIPFSLFHRVFSQTFFTDNGCCFHL